MEPLTIETFNPDMIKAINSEQKKTGNSVTVLVLWGLLVCFPA